MTLFEIIMENETKNLNEERLNDKRFIYDYLIEVDSLSLTEGEALISGVKSFLKKDLEKTKSDYKKISGAIKKDYDRTVQHAAGNAEKVKKAKAVYNKRMAASDKWLKAKMKAAYDKANSDIHLIKRKAK